MTHRPLLSLAIFTALTAAACLPAPAASTGATGGPTAAASTGGGDCAAACDRLLACQLIVDASACVDECTAQGFGPDVTGGLASGSCADDAAWLARTYPAETGGGGAVVSSGGGGGGGGGEGSSCTGGSNTCGGYTICCAPGGGSAPYGVAGVCHQAATCNMPRH